MVERNISEDLVIEALETPEKITEEKQGRKAAYKELGDKTLKVIFQEENNVYIVITGYLVKTTRVK